MIGTYVLSAGFYDAYFNQRPEGAGADRPRLRAGLGASATSSSPRPRRRAAFALGEKSADPIAMYLNDVFAVPASLAGLPAMSVPAGLDEQGLPLGLQLIGKALDEQGVLNAALALEERAGFTARPEAWW